MWNEGLLKIKYMHTIYRVWIHSCYVMGNSPQPLVIKWIGYFMHHRIKTELGNGWCFDVSVTRSRRGEGLTRWKGQKIPLFSPNRCGLLRLFKIFFGGVGVDTPANKQSIELNNKYLTKIHTNLYECFWKILWSANQKSHCIKVETTMELCSDTVSYHPTQPEMRLISLTEPLRNGPISFWYLKAVM